ncbi:hypothetical protein EB001_12770 [bacterium]|nr:hypothetical protein [bacterium]
MSSKDQILKFSLEIESIAQTKMISYMDAIVLYCEIAAKLISGALKAKIKTEAENLNFLPKSKTNRLPI